MNPLPLFLAATALAQPPSDPLVRKLTVTPAAEPQPALRYELLPPFRGKKPGNAALAYYRAYTVRPVPPTDPTLVAARSRAEGEWLETPLGRLPRKEVRKRLGEYAAVFRQLDQAAACDRCDWEWPPPSAEALGTYTVSQSRELVTALALRARLELAEGRFDDAARSIRLGLMTAKHHGEGVTLIQMLVGIAFEAITLERVEEWVARPGAPNLYWSLSDLPRPLIDPRSVWEGERLFLENSLPNLARLRSGPLPKAEARKMADEILANRRRAEREPDLFEETRPLEWAVARAAGHVGTDEFIARQLPAARRRLLDAGRTAAEVNGMPPAQVVLLDAAQRADWRREEAWKWLRMPYHQARPALQALARRFAVQRIVDAADPFLYSFGAALPAANERVLFAQARMERKVALLRTVEALRLHAAGHGGTPPARLADVTEVPVPDDPVTGKPFGYEARGTTAVLTAPPPEGETANPGNALRYEITFREPGKK